MHTRAQRYLKLDDKREAEMLQARVLTLLEEHEQLRIDTEKANKARADMERKLKDTTSKVRGSQCAPGGPSRLYQGCRHALAAPALRTPPAHPGFAPAIWRAAV